MDLTGKLNNVDEETTGLDLIVDYDFYLNKERLGNLKVLLKLLGRELSGRRKRKGISQLD